MREELCAKLRSAQAGDDAADLVRAEGAGWLAVDARDLPDAPLVFERQRLPGAVALPVGGVAETVRAVMEALAEESAGSKGDGGPAGFAALHVFPAAPAGAGGAVRRSARLSAALGAALPAVPLNAPLSPRGGRGREPVAQVCVTEAATWLSVSPPGALSSTFPGGVISLPADAEAPSHSAMKIEEALARFGEAPRAGQHVVDLGAAPGGWSRAFLKRGCRVIAVDRSALRLRDADQWGGRLLHLREDGLAFRPERPVDWLLSDMLVPPGVALGLLRKWIERGWARRFIVNVKLPQRHPHAALQPLEGFLAEAAGGRASIRQLWHDRREVTAWGHISPVPQAPVARPRPTAGGGRRRARPVSPAPPRRRKSPSPAPRRRK